LFEFGLTHQKMGEIVTIYGVTFRVTL